MNLSPDYAIAPSFTSGVRSNYPTYRVASGTQPSVSKSQVRDNGLVTRLDSILTFQKSENPQILIISGDFQISQKSTNDNFIIFRSALLALTGEISRAAMRLGLREDPRVWGGVPQNPGTFNSREESRGLEWARI